MNVKTETGSACDNVYRNADGSITAVRTIVIHGMCFAYKTVRRDGVTTYWTMSGKIKDSHLQFGDYEQWWPYETAPDKLKAIARQFVLDEWVSPEDEPDEDDDSLDELARGSYLMVSEDGRIDDLSEWLPIKEDSNENQD